MVLLILNFSGAAEELIYTVRCILNENAQLLNLVS